MNHKIWKKAELARSIYDVATAVYWTLDDERLWKAAEIANQVYEELIEEAKKED